MTENLIFNLMTYLETELPGETIFANRRDILGSNTSVPIRCILLQETGDTETPWLTDVTQAIQILTRDIDMPKARELAFDVYDKINNKFGLILPSVTVDGVVYPQIQISQISVNSGPSYIEDDENGRPVFSSNYRFIYRRT